jgi:O-antigen/teichoic acid export membrane protein
VLVARGLVLNAGIAAIGGLRLLGIWAIAERFLSLNLVMESLWRVSFPMMSRMMDAGEDVPALVARNVALVTFAVGLMSALLVGSSPALVPLLLGAAYEDAVLVIAPAALGAVLLVPVGVVVGGCLYAGGRAGAVLAPVVAQSLVLYAVTFPLLDIVGAAAIGIGSLAGCVVGAVLMVCWAREVRAAPIVRTSCRPVIASVVAGAAGVTLTQIVDDGVLGIGAARCTSGSCSSSIGCWSVGCSRRRRARAGRNARADGAGHALMRLLYVTRRAWPAIGRIESLVRHVAHGVARDHHVEIVA